MLQDEVCGVLHTRRESMNGQVFQGWDRRAFGEIAPNSIVHNFLVRNRPENQSTPAYLKGYAGVPYLYLGRYNISLVNLSSAACRVAYVHIV